MAQPERPDLARRDELGHGPRGLLDGHARVEPVVVVDVDPVGAEPGQARFARGGDVLGAAVEGLPAFGRPRGELGPEHHLVTPAPDGLAEQPLVVPEPAVRLARHRRGRAVDVGSVEEVDAEVDRRADGGDRLGTIGFAVELGHPHASEADGPHSQAGIPERDGGRVFAPPGCAVRHQCSLTQAAMVLYSRY